MSHIAEQEIRQELKRIGRKLLQGCVLRKTQRGDYAATRPGSNADKARIRVAADIAEIFLSRGLLVTTEAGCRLSADGKACLVRENAATGNADDNPYAAQHREMAVAEIQEADGRVAQCAVNIQESPLSYLRHRHLLSRDEYTAGERLRRDYTLGHLSPHMTVDLTRPMVQGRRAGPGSLSDTVLDARDRFRRALHAAGPEFSGLLYDVCCTLTGLSDAEKRRRWPRASAKVVLRLGLDRLARHYGLGISRSHAPLSAWRAPEPQEKSEGKEEMVGGEGFEPPTPSV